MQKLHIASDSSGMRMSKEQIADTSSLLRRAFEYTMSGLEKAGDPELYEIVCDRMIELNQELIAHEAAKQQLRDWQPQVVN